MDRNSQTCCFLDYLLLSARIIRNEMKINVIMIPEVCFTCRGVFKGLPILFRRDILCHLPENPRSHRLKERKYLYFRDASTLLGSILNKSRWNPPQARCDCLKFIRTLVTSLWGPYLVLLRFRKTASHTACWTHLPMIYQSFTESKTGDTYTRDSSDVEQNYTTVKKK